MESTGCPETPAKTTTLRQQGLKLTLEVGTDRFSRNAGKEPPFYDKG
jgi:hypothetical protein